MKPFQLIFSILLAGAIFLFAPIVNALPFNIAPQGTLPITAPSSATYILTNTTALTPPFNYVKWLPPNVTVNEASSTCTPSSRFSLSAGNSCTLTLNVSGPVNANDPDTHHHLFICMSDHVTCAGPSIANSLNITGATPIPTVQSVIVGNAGTILTSRTTNGTMWSPEVSGVAADLLGVTFGGGKYVTVGKINVMNATILSSTNGMSWTSESSGIATTLNAVTFGNQLYVAVGNTGRIVTSANASLWTLRTTGINNNLNGVTFGNNLYVAVGTAGAGGVGPAIILTSSTGLTWTQRVSGVSSNLRGVAYGNNTYVAVGEVALLGNPVITTSSDGITWSPRSTNITRALNGVAYGNNLFVAVGNLGAIITSPNGTTWTPQTSGTVNNLNGVIYMQGIFIAVGNNGTILTSLNGINWNTVASGVATNLNAVI